MDFSDSDLIKRLIRDGLRAKPAGTSNAGGMRNAGPSQGDSPAPPVTDAARGGVNPSIRLVWDMPMRKTAQRKTSAAFLTSIEGGKR